MERQFWTVTRGIRCMFSHSRGKCPLDCPFATNAADSSASQCFQLTESSEVVGEEMRIPSGCNCA